MNMDIGQAIEAMKQGNRCRRIGWIDRDRWVSYEPPATVSAEHFRNPTNKAYAHSLGGTVEIWACFIMKKPDGGMMPGWSPTQSDLVATDWYIVPVDGPDPYFKRGSQ